MTTLPEGFERILADGIAALRVVESELRQRSLGAREPGPILLDVRDVGGLADRLVGTDTREWQAGWGQWFNSQDVAVLREWASRLADAHTRGDVRSSATTLTHAHALSALADFLQWYIAHHTELSLPKSGSADPFADI